jgi:hypothetical protein
MVKVDCPVKWGDYVKYKLDGKLEITMVAWATIISGIGGLSTADEKRACTEEALDIRMQLIVGKFAKCTDLFWTFRERNSDENKAAIAFIATNIFLGTAPGEGLPDAFATRVFYNIKEAARCGAVDTSIKASDLWATALNTYPNAVKNLDSLDNEKANFINAYVSFSKEPTRTSTLFAALTAIRQEVLTDKKIITKVGALLSQYAVLDCPFSTGSCGMCRAHTITTGLYAGCTPWDIYLKGCPSAADDRSTAEREGRNSGIVPLLAVPFLPHLPSRYLETKIGEKTTAAAAKTYKDGYNTVEHDKLVMEGTLHYLKWMAQTHVAVCETFAAAGMFALKAAGLAARVQLVREAYASDGHAYILVGNGNMDATTSITAPTDGSIVVDFWYAGLGGALTYDVASKKTTHHNFAKSSISAPKVSESGLKMKLEVGDGVFTYSDLPGDFKTGGPLIDE